MSDGSRCQLLIEITEILPTYVEMDSLEGAILYSWHNGFFRNDLTQKFQGSKKLQITASSSRWLRKFCSNVAAILVILIFLHQVNGLDYFGYSNSFLHQSNGLDYFGYSNRFLHLINCQEQLCRTQTHSVSLQSGSVTTVQPSDWPSSFRTSEWRHI